MSTPHKTRHRRATLSNKDFITPPTSPADHPPLPKHAEKHLAQAIVLGGGPDAFSGSQAISRLCDTRPDIYGQRGDNRRRQISNKVNYWKTLNSTKFQTRVLDQLGVISPEPSTEKSNHKTLTDSDSDSDSDSDNPPSSAVELIVPSPVQELQQMKGMSSKTETALPGGAFRLQVDTERPERNREFMIFAANDVVGIDNTTRYHGYYIFMPVDIRDIVSEKGEPFEARIFTENSVLVKFSSFKQAFYNLSDELSDQVGEQMTATLDEARHKYHEERDTRQWIYIVLEFPSDHVLSVKEVNKNDNGDATLPYGMCSLPYTVTLDGSTVQFFENFIVFKVVRSEKVARKRGKHLDDKPQSRALQLLSANLSGSKVSTGSDATAKFAAPNATMVPEESSILLKINTTTEIDSIMNDETAHMKRNAEDSSKKTKKRTK